MPFLPQVAGDAHRIGQIHGEHTCRCPTVQKPGVRCIASIRIPDGGEMGRTVIGAVGVFLEGESRTLPADAGLQQTPEAFIAKLREVGHRVLRCCDSRTLGSGHPGRDSLLNAITAFQCSSCCRGGQAVRCDIHCCGQTGGVAIIIELPPALVLPPAVVYPVIPAVTVNFPLGISPAVRVPAFLPVLDPYPVLLPPWRPDPPGS